jgi:hypothetical protein
MTKAEFDQAIEAIRQGHITPREERVLVAAAFIMREIRNIPDDEEWEPTRTQLVEFINGLDKQLRSRLKRIADDVQEEKPTLH